MVHVGAATGAVIWIYGSAEPEPYKIFTTPQRCFSVSVSTSLMKLLSKRNCLQTYFWSANASSITNKPVDIFLDEQGSSVVETGLRVHVEQLPGHITHTYTHHSSSIIFPSFARLKPNRSRSIYGNSDTLLAFSKEYKMARYFLMNRSYNFKQQH
jgi:hypothetical protein